MLVVARAQAWVLGPGMHATWMGRAKGGSTVCDTVLLPLRRAVLIWVT